MNDVSNGSSTKVSFRTVTLGNLLSMATILIAGVAVYVRIEVNDGKQSTIIGEHERRITKFETDKDGAARDVAQKLEDIQRRLARIEGQLERRP